MLVYHELLESFLYGVVNYLCLLYTGSLTDSVLVVESGSLQPLPPPVQSSAEGSGYYM